MGRALFVCAVALMLAGPSFAADRTETAARELYRLVAVGGAEAIVEQMRGFAAAALTREVESRLGERFSVDERRRFQDAIDRVLAKHLSSRAFEDECVAIYTRHFTVDELEQLATFYRSPAGRKAIALQADLSSEMIAAGKRVGENLVRSRELQEELREEIRRALPGRFKKPDEEQG